MQEIRTSPEKVNIRKFTDLGYHCYWHPAEKKGYSGVTIFTLKEPDNVFRGMGSPSRDIEGRIIRADYDDLTLLNVYIPSGRQNKKRHEHKMEWISDFRYFTENLLMERKKVIICGDFNTCHTQKDIHHPEEHEDVSGFTPGEREWFDELLGLGLTDAYRKTHPRKVQYTWWSPFRNALEENKGWRIDYFLVTNNIVKKVKDVKIFDNLVLFSDHCPVKLEMN